MAGFRASIVVLVTALFALALAGDVTLNYLTYTNANCSGSPFLTNEFKGTYHFQAINFRDRLQREA
jgi:hypothetical protein